MVDSGISCTGSWTEFSSSNDSSSSLLNTWNEIFVNPFLADQIEGFLSIDSGLVQIWEHSGRMISPNAEIFNIINMAIGLISNLI